MARIKLGIDRYHPDEKGNVCVRVEFSAKSKMASFALNVRVNPKNWDNTHRTILPGEPRFKQKNRIVERIFEMYTERYEQLLATGNLPNNAYKMRDLITEEAKDITFLDYFAEVIAKISTEKTRETYQTTYNIIYSKYKNKLYFDDITVDWLREFERDYLGKGNKVNSLSVNLRNIRKVFNDAIDDEIVELNKYPFRKFKIKSEQTKHRYLPIKIFRELIQYKGNENEEWAIDVFMLSFYLIGINMKDLYNLEKTHSDKISYNRAKTHKLYEIKIEPETLEIINKYEGKKTLLNFSDNFKHADSLTKKVNKHLAVVSEKLGFEKITTYYARHTWATYAAELDIPKETISASLGHSTNSVTDVYIKFNRKKINEANRKVIDYVLGK